MVDTALNILEFSSMSEHVHEHTKNIVSKILDNQKYTPGKVFFFFKYQKIKNFIILNRYFLLRLMNGLNL